jgi:hypothetical protein
MMARAPWEKMSRQSNRHSVGTVLIKEAVQISATGTSRFMAWRTNGLRRILITRR